MLRLLGFHPSPALRLLIGVALIAFGVWRHAAIPVVAGGGVLVLGGLAVLGGSRSGDRGGNSRSQLR